MRTFYPLAKVLSVKGSFQKYLLFFVTCFLVQIVIAQTPPGNALNFDGVNDYAKSTVLVNTNFTIEFWLNTTQTGVGTAGGEWYTGTGLVDADVAGAAKDFGVSLLGSKICFGVGDGTTNGDISLSSVSSVNTGKWVHVALVRVMSSGKIKIFINGVVEDSTTAGTATLTDAYNNTMAIGASTGLGSTKFFAGSMDELRVFNTDRTANIAADMLNTVSANTTGLVTYYSFDQGTAGGSNTGISALTDQSPQGNNATLNNFALTGATSNFVQSYAMVIPTVAAATSVNLTSFTANWIKPTVGASLVSNYYVDVATDTFYTVSSIFNTYNVASSATSLAVSGLTANTTYYYRVRANNTATALAGQGTNSANAIVMPPPGNALNFGNSATATIKNEISGNFTIEFWMNTTQTGNTTGVNQWYNGTGLVDGDISGGANDFGVSLLGNNICFGTGGTSDISTVSKSIVNTGHWVHVALVRSQTNSSISIYINGVLDTTQAAGTATLSAPTTLKIGGNSTAARYYTGSMDELRLFTTDRSANIAADMLNTLSAATTGLVSYYQFDQGTAGGNNAGITSITDATTTANNGTLSGFTLSGSTSNFVESYAMVVPTASSATSISNTSFTANWSAPAIGKVTNYLLDVSTNASFSSFVTGFNGLSVSGTSKSITGLTAGTTYYYRVRADKTSVTGQGAYSAAQTVSTLSLTVTSFTPTSTGLDSLVTITGTNFTSPATVTFGGTAALSVTVNSATSITAKVGAGATGLVTVTAGTGSGTSTGTFTWLAAPTITNFTPAISGFDSTVTITGTNFTAPATVKFGGTAALAVTLVNSTTITATVGSGATGAITVNTPGGSATSAGSFTWVAAPTITNFTPTTAGVDSVVTITGTNFISPATVKFGGTTALAVTVVSPTTIMAEVGSGVTGAITVNTPGGSVTSASTFSWLPAPTITNFTPAATGLDSIVTITGTNFGSPATVTFGGTAALAVTVVNPTTITAMVGSGITGVVAVNTPGGTATGTGTFTWVAAPTITGFTPTATGADSTVTITGTNFIAPATVKFGGTAALSATIINSTTITAIVGAGATGAVTVSTPGGTATSALPFTWYAAPTITSFTPVSGGPGVQDTITGTGFTAATLVSFGGTAATSFTVVNPTTIYATPAASGASGVIAISTPGGKVISTTTFTWNAPPTIGNVNPAIAGNGSTVYIFGSNLTNVTSVSFGGTPAVSFSTLAGSYITAVVGNGSSGVVSITNPGGTATWAGFTWQAAPTITSFSPTAGGYDNDIVITGTNFIAPLNVQFGGVNTSYLEIVSKTELVADPGYSGATGKITILTNGGTATSANTFSWYPIPNVTSFTPTVSGLDSTVTITGSNFATPVTVSFGGVNALSATVVSPTTIKAVVGAGATGLVNVATPGGSASSTGVFTWAATPSISSFTPSASGFDSTVTITGANFISPATVSFGGTPALAFTIKNPTTIVATVGAGTSGNITVTTPGGNATSGSAFTWVAVPSITSFTPDTSGLNGTVTITGTNFASPAAVLFGGTPASSVTVVNPTTITAVAGAGASGYITVGTPGGSATSSNLFTWDAAPTITSFTPSAVGLDSVVTITGTNFISPASVTFGFSNTSALAVTVVNSSTITAVVGAGSSGFITVNTPGGTATSGSYFTWQTAPRINSFSPIAAGPGSTITISGSYFVSPANVTFGGTPAASVNVVNQSEITAVVGQGTSGPITVYTTGGNAISAGNFSFVLTPVLTSFTQTSTNAYDTVTISGSNLLTTSSVSFGGNNAAYFSVISDNTIKAVAGIPVANGIISVTTTGGTATLAGFTAVASPPGNALNFGTNGVLTAPTSNLNVANNYTVEMWVRPTSTPAGNIFTTGTFFELALSTNSVVATVWNGNSGQSATANYNFVVGEWYHITCSVAPNTCSLYVNGKLISTTNLYSLNASQLFTSARGGIGISPQYFSSSIDELKVWSTTRTGAQIDSDMVYTVSNPLTNNNLVLYYNFDQGIGGGNNQTVTSVFDQSANQITAALSGGFGTLYRGLMGSTNNWVESFAMVLPVAVAASNLTYSGFTANWTAPVTGTVDNYLLDVATDSNFTNIVSGYNELSVSSTSQAVTGLANGQTYYYRVRANKYSVPAQGVYSATVAVTVLGISSFTPVNAGTGDVIIIKGVGLTGATLVSFGGTAATYMAVVNDTTIKAVVGTGATGSVAVTLPSGTVSLAGFTYFALGSITSFTPSSGAVYDTITINGTLLSSATSVTFGGIPAASFTVISDNVIKAVLAAGATGVVTVKTIGGTAKSATQLNYVSLAPPGNALNFNGTSNYISAPVKNNLTVDSNFTVEAWVKPGDPTASGTIVSSTGSQGNFDMAINSGYYWSFSIGGYGYNAYLPYNINRWYHFAVTVSPTGYVIYVNGANAGSGTVSGSNNLELFDSIYKLLTIGAYIANVQPNLTRFYFKGNIDEVKIYNTARSQAQVQADMFAVLINPTADATLVNYYNFDEGTAGGNNPNITSLFDYSTNNTTGTLNHFGLSGSTSNWVQSYAMTVPVKQPATNIKATSFTANWSAPAVGTAAHYILEVFNNNYFYNPTTTIVSGTSAAVTGLSPQTTYYYRVTAYNDSATGLSNYTDTVGVTTVTQPHVTSFTPNIGATGTAVTISGSNFTPVTSVSFGGSPASSFTINSNSTITAIVGAGSNGKVYVTSQGGTDSLGTFTYIGIPVITSFTPTSGGILDTVMIYGTSLLTANAVSFGGVAASSFTATSDTSVRAILAGGATGIVSVTTQGGAATSAGFIYLGPAITSFTPTSANILDAITIYGTRLKTTTAVSFGGVPAASFSVNNNNSITALVGPGASGSVSVTTQGGVATSPGFTYSTYTNPVTLTPPGNALNFTGSNYVEVPVGNTTISGSYTVEAWVKPTSTGGTIFSTRVAGEYSFDLQLNNNYFNAYIGNGSYGLVDAYSNYFTFNTGQWLHIAIAVTPGAYTMYANGSIVGNGTFSGTPLLLDATHNLLTIGSQGSGGYFNGSIDEVKVWNTARTQAQVSTDMLGPVTNPAITTGLAAYYNFDEGTASGTNTGITQLIDLSANQLTGKLYNFGLSGSTGNWVESYAMVVPTATAATAITETSFTANWAAPQVGTVDNYIVTVNGPNGNSQVTVAGTNTFYNVTGLTPGSSYSYYVTANKASVTGQGASSNTITANTTGIYAFSPQTAGSGTAITINGYGLTGATAVSFGGVPVASFTVVDSATINAVVGIGASGNVSVTLPTGTNTVSGFTYVGADTVLSFSPTTAGVFQTVTIIGRNLSTTTAVSFGGTPAASFNVLSDTSIQAVVAEGSSGSVSVTTLAGTASKSGFNYSTVALPPPGNAMNLQNGSLETNTGNINVVNNFTVEAWVMPADTVNTFGIFRGGYYTPFQMDIEGGNIIRTTIGDGSSYLLDVNFPFHYSAGKWYHIAVAVSPSGYTIYVNGNPIGSGSIAAAPLLFNNNNSVMYIGSDDYGGPYGSIDELKIWNATRSQQQISADMVNIVNSPASNDTLVAYYDFDEGTPGGNNTAVTSLFDRSANALTINNLNYYLGLTGNTGNFVESYAMVVPTISTVTSIGRGKLSASWTAPVNGTVNGYLLDVALDSPFTQYAPGYNSKAVAGTSQVISGLTPGIHYYLRVSAVKNTTVGISASSPTDSIMIPVVGTPPVVTSFTPSTGVIGGTTVVIKGSNFTGAFGVSFGGDSATSFTIVSDNEIDAVVSNDGASGNVAVTGPGGAGTLAGFTFNYLPPYNALNFDGIDDNVIISNPLSTDYTIEYWMRTTQTNGGGSQWYQGYGVVDGDRPGSDFDLGTSLLGTKLAFGTGNPNNYGDVTITSNSDVNTGKWVFVAATRNATTGMMKLFINGVAEDSTIAGTDPLATNSTLTFGGANTGGNNFQGSLDEVRLFTTDRSANIMADMADTINRTTSSLAAYFNFDEGIPGADNTAVNTLYDQTSNGVNGTLNNFALTGNTSNWVESYAMVVPKATPPTNITGTGFTANWAAPAVGVVDNYLLDVATDSAFTNIITGYNAATFTGTSVAVSGLNPRSIYYYRVRADKASVTGQGGYSNTDSGVTTTALSWIGVTDVNWNNATNWASGTVPTATDNVVIPAGTPYSPALNTAAAANNIAIASGAALTINAAGALTAAGSINNSGTFNGSTGSLVLNGTAAQTIAGSITVNNLTINNTSGVSINSGTTKVYGVYTPQAGVLTTNGNLVLASTATSTASVAASTVNNYVTGNVTVERYIPAHRAWRLLTAPLSNTGTIYQNWQNNGVADGSTGAAIWKPGGTGGSGNGFTAGGGEASIESYDPIANNWVGLSNTTSTLLSGTATSAANTGIGLFVTGPFGSNNIAPATGAAATTLRAAGSLQTGTQQFVNNGLTAGTFMLVGNPYASPLNFTNIGATGATSGNISNTMWAWDAQRKGTSYGGYVTFSWDATAGSYDQDISADSTAQTMAVQSGEAFFVQAVNNGNATVTINETDKAATSAITGGVFGVQPPATPAQQIRISLNRGTEQVDGVLAKFGDAYKTGLSDDVDKLFDYDENLSLRIDTNYLAIERRPILVAGDTMYLDAYALKKNTAYSFTVNPQNMPAGLQAWLVDGYTNTKTVLSMAGSTTVSFSTGTDAGSLSETRFVIVFQTNGVLATATTLKAVPAGSAVLVEWVTPNELGVKEYQVQRSADAQNFTTVNTEAARNSGNKEVYNYTDEQPIAGGNYYRIEIFNADGTVTYSNVVLVKMARGVATFSIYPNPTAHNGQLHVQFTNMAAGRYALVLYSTSGKQLMDETIMLDGTTTLQTISLPQGIASGSYRMVLLDGNGGEWKKQLLVQ